MSKMKAIYTESMFAIEDFTAIIVEETAHGCFDTALRYTEMLRREVEMLKGIGGNS